MGRDSDTVNLFIPAGWVGGEGREGKGFSIRGAGWEGRGGKGFADFNHRA